MDNLALAVLVDPAARVADRVVLAVEGRVAVVDLEVLAVDAAVLAAGARVAVDLVVPVADAEVLVDPVADAVPVDLVARAKADAAALLAALPASAIVADEPNKGSVDKVLSRCAMRPSMRSPTR